MKLTRKHIRKLIIESLEETFDRAWYLQDPYGPHYSVGFRAGQEGGDKWSKAFGIVQQWRDNDMPSSPTGEMPLPPREVRAYVIGYVHGNDHSQGREILTTRGM